MDPRDAVHQSGSSADILSESGEVTPAAAADVPAFGPTPSAAASRGFWRRPAWVHAGHDLPDPNPLGPTEAEGVVLPSDVVECVVRQGPVVPCIHCLE